MGKSIRLMLAGALCLAPSVVPADGWLFDGTVGLIGYDNAARARLVADHRGATAIEIDGSGHYQPAVQTAGVVSFELWAGADRYDRFHGLNQIRAGFGATYFARIGLGPTAPWWSASTRAGYHDFDSPLRDGATWEAAVSTGKNWRDRLDVTARATVRRRQAESAVFAGSTVRLGLEVDYLARPDWSVFCGVAWQRGDLVSAAASVGDIGPVWVVDATFGAGWHSYRVDADVLTSTLGAQFSVGNASQFVLAWERVDGRARTYSADYDGNIYRAQIFHEF